MIQDGILTEVDSMKRFRLPSATYGDNGEDLRKAREEGLFKKMSVLQRSIDVKVWRKQVTKVVISDFVPVSAEALVLLTIDNSMKVWKYDLEKEEERVGERPPAEYTGKGDGQNSGWTSKGLKKYEEYTRHVVAERKEEGRVEAEKRFLEYMRNGNSKPTKRKSLNALLGTDSMYIDTTLLNMEGIGKKKTAV